MEERRSCFLLSRLTQYSLRRSLRSKSIRLTVRDDGVFEVTIPSRMNIFSAEEFIAKKSEWILKKFEYFRNLGGSIFKVKKGDIARLKKEAYLIVLSRLKYFNVFYRFTYKKIAIKNQKSRWGSCSKKGNLNFNYKISILPPHIADYIIVHELCHIGELNHSKNFWNLVAKTIPDYKESRAQLRKTRIRFV